MKLAYKFLENCCFSLDHCLALLGVRLVDWSYHFALDLLKRKLLFGILVDSQVDRCKSTPKIWKILLANLLQEKVLVYLFATIFLSRFYWLRHDWALRNSIRDVLGLFRVLGNPEGKVILRNVEKILRCQRVETLSNNGDFVLVFDLVAGSLELVVLKLDLHLDSALQKLVHHSS